VVAFATLLPCHVNCYVRIWRQARLTSLPTIRRRADQVQRGSCMAPTPIGSAHTGSVDVGAKPCEHENTIGQLNQLSPLRIRKPLITMPPPWASRDPVFKTMERIENNYSSRRAGHSVDHGRATARTRIGRPAAASDCRQRRCSRDHLGTLRGHSIQVSGRSWSVHGCIHLFATAVELAIYPEYDCRSSGAMLCLLRGQDINVDHLPVEPSSMLEVPCEFSG